MMNFQGSGKRIDDYDIPRIGALIGVGEDEVHAVLDVESSGSVRGLAHRAANILALRLRHSQHSQCLHVVEDNGNRLVRHRLHEMGHVGVRQAFGAVRDHGDSLW